MIIYYCNILIYYVSFVHFTAMLQKRQFPLLQDLTNLVSSYLRHFSLQRKRLKSLNPRDDSNLQTGLGMALG